MTIRQDIGGGAEDTELHQVLDQVLDRWNGRYWSEALPGVVKRRIRSYTRVLEQCQEWLQYQGERVTLHLKLYLE